jgi:hypothetical protein
MTGPGRYRLTAECATLDFEPVKTATQSGESGDRDPVGNIPEAPTVTIRGRPQHRAGPCVRQANGVGPERQSSTFGARSATKSGPDDHVPSTPGECDIRRRLPRRDEADDGLAPYFDGLVELEHLQCAGGVSSWTRRGIGFDPPSTTTFDGAKSTETSSRSGNHVT